MERTCWWASLRRAFISARTSSAEKKFGAPPTWIWVRIRILETEPARATLSTVSSRPWRSFVIAVWRRTWMGTPSLAVYFTCSPSPIPRTEKRHWVWKNLESRRGLFPSGERHSRSTFCSAMGRSSSSQDSSTRAKMRSGIPISLRMRNRRPALRRMYSMYVSLVRPSPHFGRSKSRGTLAGRSWLTIYLVSRVALIRSSGHHKEEKSSRWVVAIVDYGAMMT